MREAQEPNLNSQAPEPHDHDPLLQTLSAGAGDLCMTGLSAVTNAMGKGAGRVFILIQVTACVVSSCRFGCRGGWWVFPPGQEAAFPWASHPDWGPPRPGDDSHTSICSLDLLFF